MEKFKKLKLSIMTLLLALVVAFTAAAFAVSERAVFASADDNRYVELDGNKVFYTAIQGAEIEATDPDNEEETATHYTLFKMGNEQTVSYRQNLAYKWKTAGGVDFAVPEDKAFSMELYFPENAFKRVYIKFESQQYRLTEDGKSVNYLVFTANGESVDIGVYNSVGEKKLEKPVIEEDDLEERTAYTQIGTAAIDGHIKISFGSYNEGDYTIKLNDNITGGKFKNVYEDFASYVASGDNAVTPLTFGAVFTDKSKDDNSAQMALVDINGQSFEMKKDGDVYKVIDTASPVLCFSQTPSYLEYGKSIGLQYRVIDVIESSPRATAYYYVLEGWQVENPEFVYDKTDYSTTEDDGTTDEEGSEGSGEGEEGGTDEGGETEPAPEPITNPFIKVTSSSSERIYPDENTFIPQKYLKSDVMGLVKIYYEISDVTTSKAKTDKVFVDWYVDDSALEDVKEYNGEKQEGTKFLKLIKSKKGVTYAESETATYDEYIAGITTFETNYQNVIYAAISELEDGKLYAGGNKFYLPSLDYGYFNDEYLKGTDYKYSIYYKGKSSGSHASLDFNKLAIDLNDADVTYRFTIYITDSFGNPMRYPDPDNEGEWKEIKNNSSDIWDAVEDGLLPYFEFEVSYKEATAEPPENLSISYVTSSYNGVSFDIKGVSGTYTPKYNLYIFDKNAYDREVAFIDYDEFVEKTEELFNNVETRKYFTTVKPVSELLESDENYEKFKALNWNATSISFKPQSVEDFYVVELELTDNRSQKPVSYYATVASSVQTNSLKGETDWLGNNKTSIILFAVAGVCLVALVVLLVVKPKDKGDIDTVYTEVEGKGKSAKKKKSE